MRWLAKLQMLLRSIFQRRQLDAELDEGILLRGSCPQCCCHFRRPNCQPARLLRPHRFLRVQGSHIDLCPQLIQQGLRAVDRALEIHVGRMGADGAVADHA
jgi:hypothetical protein